MFEILIALLAMAFLVYHTSFRSVIVKSGDWILPKWQLKVADCGNVTRQA
jgi:hypothetical protein